MVEGHTGEFGVTGNEGIWEVPFGGAKRYLADAWRGIRRQDWKKSR